MKIEKINKDKIKVTLNNDDLLANDIDFHSFMSDSEETHSLFLNVLKKAETDFDFSTDNYRLRVETIALANGNFVMTITRELDKISSLGINKKPKANIKIPNHITSSVIYKFQTFDDFELFINYINKNSLDLNINVLFKDTILYKYNNCYYLIFKEINVKYPNKLKKLFSSIVEFSTYVDFSDIFIAKLYENGKVIFDKKAIQNYNKYFNPET